MEPQMNKINADLKAVWQIQPLTCRTSTLTDPDLWFSCTYLRPSCSSAVSRFSPPASVSRFHLEPGKERSSGPLTLLGEEVRVRRPDPAWTARGTTVTDSGPPPKPMRAQWKGGKYSRARHAPMPSVPRAEKEPRSQPEKNQPSTTSPEHEATEEKEKFPSYREGTRLRADRNQRRLPPPDQRPCMSRSLS